MTAYPMAQQRNGAQHAAAFFAAAAQRVSVGADGPRARQTAEGEFAGKAHPSEKGNKAEINQQERRAAVLAHAVREHPDVAHAHGGADRGKDEADAVFEIGRLVLLHEKAFLSAAAELRPAAV